MDAIGKPVRLDEAKGKGKGVRGAGKGSNGKGKPTMVKSSLRASIFVLEPDTGYMMWYQIAIGNLLNSKELVYLELDDFSSTVPLSINCDGNDIVEFDTTHMGLCLQNEVTLLLVGSYVNMVLYLEVVDEKQSISGDAYLQVSIQDTAGVRDTFQFYGHSAAHFCQGDTVLALCHVACAGRNDTGGQWVDDSSWSQAQYSAHRSVISKVYASACFFMNHRF